MGAMVNGAIVAVKVSDEQLGEVAGWSRRWGVTRSETARWLVIAGCESELEVHARGWGQRVLSFPVPGPVRRMAAGWGKNRSDVMRQRMFAGSILFESMQRANDDVGMCPPWTNRWGMARPVTTTVSAPQKIVENVDGAATAWGVSRGEAARFLVVVGLERRVEVECVHHRWHSRFGDHRLPGNEALSVVLPARTLARADAEVRDDPCWTRASVLRSLIDLGRPIVGLAGGNLT